MLTIPPNTRISLCASPVDLRKSFNGLIALVRSVLADDPVSGHLFVFINRTQTLMKILYWDGDGFAIWFKRLESGTFRLPARSGNAPAIELTRSGLALILEGIDLSQLPKRKRYTRNVA